MLHGWALVNFQNYCVNRSYKGSITKSTYIRCICNCLLNLLYSSVKFASLSHSSEDLHLSFYVKKKLKVQKCLVETTSVLTWQIGCVGMVRTLKYVAFTGLFSGCFEVCAPFCIANGLFFFVAPLFPFRCIRNAGK